MDSMKRLEEIMSRQNLEPLTSRGSKEFQKLRVDDFNNLPGDMIGYDCPICKNKGQIAVFRPDEDDELYTQCECIPIRRNLTKVKNSGLETVLKEKTFETFNAYTRAHAELVIQAKRYANNPVDWFCMIGKSGTGKTHVCTAIVGKLLEKNIPCKYMLWREEAPKLKAHANDPIYASLVEPYKTVKCLYIDDLFKGGITQADLNLAIEILNHRYMDRRLLTIISTEKKMEELLKLDEAIGGRIYERSKGNLFEISKWGNYRLRQ